MLKNRDATTGKTFVLIILATVCRALHWLPISAASRFASQE